MHGRPINNIEENRPNRWQSRRRGDNIKIDFVETECEIMLDSSGSENGGVCENIYKFFEFYNRRRISQCQNYLLA